jgi:hypothetical protein
MKFEQKLISRIFTILILSGISFGLYSTTNSDIPKPVEKPKLNQTLSLNPGEIDRNIDSLLVKYGVILKRVRKKKILVPGNDFVRIERLVPIPPQVVPLFMTADFHALAKRYGGRAIASENLKENSVTVHIEAGKNIIQSLILRHAAYVYEPVEKDTKVKSLNSKKNHPVNRTKKQHRIH